MNRTRSNSDEPLKIGGLSIRPGDRIGSYVFVREIGSGGMARVLLARDPGGELIALKVLRKNRFKTGLARFRREFRALSRINHPNVIRVDAYGDLFGHPYIAMEYVDGLDLHTTIRNFKMWDPTRRWRRCEEILVDLCRSLSVVHRRGLVHRDLKPSNILLNRDGTAKLTDFGIVKDLDPGQDPLMSTTLVGTWAYASPEQISGHAIDHRSDLYSLGIILFAMLTGKRPFVAKDMAGYLALHRDRPAPAPRDVFPNVPKHLDEICRRLLQKAPRERFQSAQEILYRLEAEDRPSVPSDADAWTPPLVGRHLELDALNEAVAGLTDRRGGMVVLEGDAGSGRSRLLDAVGDRARELGFPIHRHEFSPNAPVFTGTIRLARELMHEFTDLPSDLRDRVTRFTELDAHPGDARYALYDAVKELFELALSHGPRILLLDQVNDANALELDLLSYLARTLLASEHPEPLLMVASLRPRANPAADRFAAGEGLGMVPTDITVGPLSPENIDQVVLSMLGDTKSSRLLAHRLHQETEGNAYFVTEFLRSLMSSGTIVQTPRGWRLTIEPEEITTGHLEIPPGVRQIMKKRLDEVDEFDREVLRGLAVSGREVDLDVLLEVLDQDEEPVLDALDRLLAAGIVRERRTPDAVYHGVTHRKFADVVYRDMAPERRAELHSRIAGALELQYAQDPAAMEVIGEHYRLAGDAGRAYRYLVAAARRLADHSLTAEAWSLCEKAGTLEDSASISLEPEVFRGFQRDHLVVRANVHYNRAEWGDAEVAWRAVLRQAEEDGDPRGACEARLRLATTLRRRSRYDESAQMSREGLDQARKIRFREGVAEALHNLAGLAWAQGDLEECERLANEGLLVTQGNKMPEQRAELLLALTVAQATRGHLASATSGLNEAEQIFRDLRMKRPRCLALANIAELLTWQGNPVEARQRAHSAVQLAVDVDYELGRTAAVRAMSVAALDLGAYETAQSGLHQALRAARRIKLAEEVLACQVALTQLCLERRDLTGACRHAARALEVAEEHDPERYLPLIRTHLARALAPSRPDGARALLRAVKEVLAFTPVPRRAQTQMVAAWAYHALGEDKDAREQAEIVLTNSSSRGYRLLKLEALSLLCQVGDPAERDAHRDAGRALAREFIASLSPELRRSFGRRPFLKNLEKKR